MLDAAAGCGRRSPGYDTGRSAEGPRRWRGLDLGTIRVFLEAEMRRVLCRDHGVVAVQVPWARHGSWFTRFAEEAGIDPSGLRVATFEGGDVHTVKPALEATFLRAGWDVTHEDHWSGGVATAYYALEQGGTHMIVEIWELEGGDSRLHYFYRQP